VQHVLPLGFVRIRHYGYLANPTRDEALALGRKLIGFTPKPREADSVSPSKAPWRCPTCGGAMQIGPILTAAELAFRCMHLDTSRRPRRADFPRRFDVSWRARVFVCLLIRELRISAADLRRHSLKLHRGASLPTFCHPGTPSFGPSKRANSRRI
jgi:hypothetical protein